MVSVGTFVVCYTDITCGHCVATAVVTRQQTPHVVTQVGDQTRDTCGHRQWLSVGKCVWLVFPFLQGEQKQSISNICPRGDQGVMLSFPHKVCVIQHDYADNGRCLELLERTERYLLIPFICTYLCKTHISVTDWFMLVKQGAERVSNEVQKCNIWRAPLMIVIE